jgi:hypothetical protein
LYREESLKEFAEETIVERIGEQFKIYDKEVDFKVQGAILIWKGEVKELREYITSLHNEIGRNNFMFRKYHF